MYAANTILVLKDQRPADPETKEPFAYNRVRVVGESPVGHAHKGKWTGAEASGVILTPLANFGGVLDEPFGKCRQLYEVESIPAVVAVQTQVLIPVVDSATGAAGMTPEEVFASEAPGPAPAEGQIRARTSPLGDPGGPPSADGPLGDTEPEVLIPVEQIEDSPL